MGITAADGILGSEPPAVATVAQAHQQRGLHP